jgi:hypothetical protein
MALQTKAVDPGSGTEQKVDATGAAHVLVRDVPPLHGEDDYRIYRAYFTDSAASSDMLVDGSTTNVEVSIRADSDNDRYIYSVSVQIADATSTLAKFGGVAALTNGVLFQYTGETTVTIHEGLKTNGDFIRLSGGTPAFGDATTAFQFPNIGPPGVPVIGYMPMIYFQHIFGKPVPLRRGTQQKLTFTIRDNCTGPDQFDAIAHGYDRVPD